MTHPDPSSRHVRLAVVALAALTLITHGVDVTHEFLRWDDHLLLTRNELLNPVTARSLWRFWSGPVQGLYSPLAYTLWAAVTVVGRVSTPDANQVTLNPAVFHALNVLLHAGCVMMVFVIARQLTGTLLPAAMGAAFFAVHPLTVEAVAWVAGMNNLLAALFSLAAVAAYVRWTRRPGWRWYGAAGVAFALACCSKPTATVVPLVLLPIDWLVLRRPIRRVAAGVAPLLLVAVPFVVIARYAQESTGIIRPAIGRRLLVACDAIGWHLGKLVWPYPLHMDYGRTPESVFAAGLTVFAAVGIIVVVAAALTIRRRAWIAGALGVFLAGMCLTLGLVPFDFQNYSTVADRYTYLALLGPAMLIAMALARSPKAARGVAACLLLPLMILSIRQSRTWATTEALIAQQTRYQPDTLAAHTLLAGAADRRDDKALAEQHYRAVLRLKPGMVDTHINLANLLRETGRYEEAIGHYQFAFGAGERKAMLFNNWGLALFALKRFPEAADAFRVAVATDPELVNGHINLALVLANLGKWDESEAHFRTALGLKPDSPEALAGLAKVRRVRPK